MNEDMKSLKNRNSKSKTKLVGINNIPDSRIKILNYLNGLIKWAEIGN